MSFGETLRTAREAKGLTTSQLAAATHILVQVIEGLEKENFKRIPAGTLIMHQRVYAADEEQIADVREGYRLYQLIPPRKRHHRLSMEEQVKKAGTVQE